MPLLPETMHRVDDLVAKAQSYGQVPSVVAGVIRDGALVHTTGAGLLPDPDPDVQYRIGSLTKTFTAALVLRLRDEGALTLDDPVRRHLPDAGLGTTTIRALLSHAGGLRREPEGGEWWERAPGVGTERLLAGVTPDLLSATPGSYHYSNLAYGLLGAVTSRITGLPWPAQVHDLLLEPLGMARTTYHAEEPFARGYVVHPWHGTLREEPRHDGRSMAPAGQLWSTVTDLARWAAFLARPAAPVLAPATVTQMCTPAVIADPEAWTSGYGLGLQLWRRGERVYIGHTGSMPGYLAVLAVHRQSGTGAVVLVNAYTLRSNGPDNRPGSVSRLGLDIVESVLESEPGRVAPWRPGAGPPAEVEALTGRWWWMGLEYEASWRAGTRELWLCPVGDPDREPWRFTGQGEDRWHCHSGSNAGEVLTVRRGRSGGVAALDIATCLFTREPWPSL